MCPRCRHHASDELGPQLERCPTHPDTVLVSPAAIAEAEDDPFLGMVVGGRFAVLERLGAGSMGTVYRARHEAMRREVALKIVRSERLVDKQAKGRFEQEARATSLLVSPHTVTVFDFGEVEIPGDDPHFIGGSLFLAMELLTGESLGDRLKRKGRVPLEQAMRVVRHTLLSLMEAHDKGIIHRDLKPDNLLLTRSPDGAPLCKVLDFGIAKLLTREGGIDALETQAGTVFGTPRYMSPEQAQGKKLDARSDLYALGVILYHMLAGRPPFTDGDAVVVMAHHIKTAPKRPSEVVAELDLPGPLEDLLMRVLDKDPARRPQSAREFLEVVDGLSLELPGLGSGVLTAVLGGAARRAAPSRRMIVFGAAAIAVGALTVGLALPDGEPRQRAKQGAPVLAATRTSADATASRAPAAAGPQAPSPDAGPSASGTGAPAVGPSPVASPGRSARPALPPRGYTRFDRP